MSAVPQSAQPIPKADAAAWMAVAAGTLGAMMATLDISIVNSSLPTIQGEIGASGTEGTWIATAYLVAEIVVIPLSGWLVKVFGLRKLLLVASSLFTAFSILCGLSSTLPMMIFGRAGQGITGGVLIPTAMTIIATRLPRSEQPKGNTLFGLTVILGPVLGPVLGGWLTENISWHYAFFINLPVGIALFILLLVGLPAEKPNWEMVRDADWLGIVGMALGLGGLTMVLEEGQREQWFSSPEICWVTAASVLGFTMIAIGQLRAAQPVINLRLLRDRQFSAIVVMAMAVGMALYGTAYVIPQFLSTISGYNSLQAGEVVLLSGVPMIMMMPFMPLLLKYVPIRVSVGFGMVLLALSAWIEVSLTPFSDGPSFVASQLLRGVGTVCAMMFLNQAAIRSVPPSQAGDASGLYNAARNLGGSLALASIAVIQEQRMWLHSRRIEETLSASSDRVQDYIAQQSQALGGTSAAFQSLGNQIQIQALTMTYSDLFWLLTVGIVCISPLVFLLRPLPMSAPPVQGH